MGEDPLQKHLDRDFLERIILDFGEEVNQHRAKPERVLAWVTKVKGDRRDEVVPACTEEMGEYCIYCNQQFHLPSKSNVVARY